MRGAAPPVPSASSSSPSSSSTAADGKSAQYVKPSAPPPPPAGWRNSSTTYPPGLHSLMPLDHVYFLLKYENLADLTVGEKNYRLLDLNGREIYEANEDSNTLNRWMLGKYRHWEYILSDGGSGEAMRIVRGFGCADCCVPFVMQSADVYSGDEFLGSVHQIWDPWRPTYTINDYQDRAVLIVKGPLTQICAAFTGIDFEIKSVAVGNRSSQRVGVLTSKYTGLPRTIEQRDVSFCLGFPADLDVKIKAVLIGASFLINSIFIESHTILRQL